MTHFVFVFEYVSVVVYTILYVCMGWWGRASNHRGEILWIIFCIQMMTSATSNESLLIFPRLLLLLLLHSNIFFIEWGKEGGSPKTFLLFYVHALGSKNNIFLAFRVCVCVLILYNGGLINNRIQKRGEISVTETDLHMNSPWLRYEGTSIFALFFKQLKDISTVPNFKFRCEDQKVLCE